MAKIKKYKSNSEKVVSIYSCRTKWKTIIPESIFEKFNKIVDSNPVPFKGFKKDVALYFLGLLVSIPARKKDKEYIDGFIPLYSPFLKKVWSKYNLYMDYLEKCELIIVNHYYNNIKHESKKYKLVIDSDCNKKYILAEITNNCFLNKLNTKFTNHELAKTHSCFIKWYNDELKIDLDGAKQKLYDKLSKIKKKDINKMAASHWYSILSLNHQNFSFSRNPKSDNRFHSSFTNFPKIYKPLVTYEEENLVSFDIKNSQPFFLVLFIEDIIRNRNNIGDIYSKEIKGNICTMLPLLVEQIENNSFMKEFECFKNWVLNGDFYEKLGELFEHIKADSKENYKHKFYDKDIKKMKWITFDTKRDLMKKLALNLLYTPLLKPTKDYEFFKQRFPQLCSFMEIIKTENTYFEDKDRYKFFPKVLQHIEAKCVLDYVGKKFTKKYPNIPIWTIHDSWVTTESTIDVLEQEVKTLLLEYCNGIVPKLEKEHWNKEQKEVEDTFKLVA